MTTTITKDQLNDLTVTDNGQAVSDVKKYEGEFEGTFKGTLVGNATTAKELEAPYNFSLSGDASGTVAVNAKSVILETTVNHAKQADTADFAGKTNLSARASLADMANTAEFAYRAGRLAKLIINLTGVVTGKGESVNNNTLDIEVTDFDASKQFIVGALATEPDTSKVYIDVTNKHFWIYDNVGAQWVDCFKQLADELNSHNLRIEALEGLNAGDRLTALEGRADSLETITADHETRITANKKVIDNHELRLNNIETTTDLGQVTLRITAIEEKNKEQDTSIGANATAIAKETSDREQAITAEATTREDVDNALGIRLDNVEAKDTEQDTHLGTIDTHLGTIDTHLGTIDAKNTEQDTKLDTVNIHLDNIDTKNTEQDNKLSTIDTQLGKIEGLITSAVPTGTIIPFAGSTIPTGYLLCNGATVSRTSYAALFGVISTLYGTGDGTTTFNLPDLRDRFLEGAGTNALAAYLEAGLPNITGWFTLGRNTGIRAQVDGILFKFDIGMNAVAAEYATDALKTIFDPSRVTSIFGKSTTVQPSALAVQYLIKY